MHKIIRICILVLLLAIVLVPCDKTFASSNSARRAARTSNVAPSLKSESTSLLTGTSDTLTVFSVPPECEVTYKSSDESILTVIPKENYTCEYTGVGVGTATITIKIQEPVFLFVSSTYTLKFTVNVTPKAVSVKFRKDKYKFDIGESRKLLYTLRPSITDEVPIFESSDSNIVSVSSKGKIYTKAKGIAYITATISNGSFDTCKITVK